MSLKYTHVFKKFKNNKNPFSINISFMKIIHEHVGGYME